MSKSGHDERAKQDLETKWTSGGHGQSIGLPSVVKAVIHCHTETFFTKIKGIREQTLTKMCTTAPHRSSQKYAPHRTGKRFSKDQ